MLLASQTIDTPAEPITQIRIEDTGEFQFKTDQTFQPQAGNAQIAQNSGEKPRSGIFIRTADGKVYGNPLLVPGAIPFVSAGPQTKDTFNLSDGRTEYQIITPLNPSDGASFQLTESALYDSGNLFVGIGSSVAFSGPGQFDFSVFAVVDVNPLGKGTFDPVFESVASIGGDGQTHFVLDPQVDAPFDADFHEDAPIATIVDRIQNGGDLAFTTANPQPTSPDVRDDALAVEWAGESTTANPDVVRGYSFFVGIDPVGAAGSIDTRRPEAVLFAPSTFDRDPNADTQRVTVTYRDVGDKSSGFDPSIFGTDDIIISGPGFGAGNNSPIDAQIVGTSFLSFDIEYTFSKPNGFGTNVYDLFLNPQGIKDEASNTSFVGDANSIDTGTTKLGFIETGTPRLTITPTLDAQALREKLIRPDSGLIVTDFSVRGQSAPARNATSAGTFVDPGGIYGLDPAGGVIISTGNAARLGSGADPLTQDSSSYGIAADAAQKALLDSLDFRGRADLDYNDVTQIDVEFDLPAGSDSVFINMAWGTEELPTFLGNQDPRNNAFGIFVNGENIARFDESPASGLIDVESRFLARVEGTTLDRVIAPGGIPALTFSKAGLSPTGNKITFIIANEGSFTETSAAYLTGLSVHPPPVLVQRARDFGTGIDVLAVARQQEKLLVAGTAPGGGPVLRRFAGSGLDQTFGNSGTAASLGFGSGAIQAIVVDDQNTDVDTGDERIYVAGSASGNILVARYNVNGQIDPTFGGGDGIVTLDTGSEFDTAYAIVLDRQQRIVVVGSTDMVDGSGNTNYVVARFTSDGSLDTSFSDDGFTIDSFNAAGNNRAGSVVITRDDKVLLAGQSDSSAALARYSDNGQLDASFDADGKRLLNDVKTADPTLGLALQGDKILVAGSDFPGALTDLTGSNFVLVRLESGGSLDPTFGSSGAAKIDMGGAEDADSIVLRDGRIFVIGTRAVAKVSDPNDIIINTAVAGFGLDGAPDLDFGTAGFTFYDPVEFETVDAGAAPEGLNRFHELFRALGVGTGDGIVTSKPNPGGGDSRVIEIRELNPDPSPPNPTLIASSLDAAAQSFSFVIRFEDDDGVDVSDVGIDDVRVNNGDTVLVVSAAVVDNGADGSPRAVTYTVAPADGSFDAMDGGTYTVTLLAGQVSDADETSSSADQVVGTFDVNIPVVEGIGGRNKGSFADPSTGVPVVIQLNTGTAKVFFRDGRIDLVLDGTTSASTLNIKARGAVSLGDVTVNGSLRAFNGKTADLAGVMSASGSLGKTTLASMSAGSILAASGTIAGITASSMSGAKVLAGTNLGADHALGGGDDAFAAGSISRITVKGNVSGCVFAAGVNPGPAGAYGDSDDTSTGGAMGPMSITGGTDPTTLFMASAFPKSAKLGGKVTPALDPRFKLLG